MHYTIRATHRAPTLEAAAAIACDALLNDATAIEITNDDKPLSTLEQRRVDKILAEKLQSGDCD